MLVTLNDILPAARRQKRAIGAFNFNDLEFLQGILDAAEELKSPVIVQTSEGAIEYMGWDGVGALISIIKKTKVPVVMHLDHGKNLAVVKKAIKSGFYSSIMYDGSALPYAENVKNTKALVKLAHARKMSVEAELGVLKGKEDNVSSEESQFTDPGQAVEFVKATGCDALAVAVGTSHGAYKFKGVAKLDLTRLEEIGRLVKIPLVLHGASGVDEHLKEKIKEGCEMLGDCERVAGAKGVPDEEIVAAIKLGVAKINIDTDLRLAFTAGVRNELVNDVKNIDPRAYLKAGKSLVTEIVKEKIKLFSNH